jgi:two-component system LytT family sensor kinase
MKIRLGDTELGLSRYIGMWSAVVIVFAVQWYVRDVIQGNTVWSIADYLRWSMIEWYTWAALAPMVFRLAARYPIASPLSWRSLRGQLLASVGVTFLAIVIGATVSHFFEPGTLDEQLWQFASWHAATGFLVYFALVAIQRAVHFHHEKTRREVEASQLAAELAHSRLQVLKTQLQPHFLFNTLHAIVTLLDEDTASAEDMLLRLSDLLRAFLEDYDGQEITLQRELALLDLYLGIQRTRFKDRLTTQVYVSPDTLDCAVPSLILQPLVENAIRHGIGKHVGSDCIEIEARREGDSLCLEVRNRNSVLELASTSDPRRGIGLSNTQLRLRELYGDAAQIRLDILWPRGVACRIRLPFREIAEPAPTPARDAA